MNQYFLCSVTHLKQRVSPDIEMSELLKQTPAGWMAGCWGSVSKANTTYISDTRAVFALVNGSIESLLKLLRHPPSNGLFPPRTPRLIDECKSLTSPQKWVRVVDGTAFRIPRERGMRAHYFVPAWPLVKSLMLRPLAQLPEIFDVKHPRFRA
jgi:hypothetical protein